MFLHFVRIRVRCRILRSSLSIFILQWVLRFVYFLFTCKPVENVFNVPSSKLVLWCEIDSSMCESSRETSRFGWQKHGIWERFQLERMGEGQTFVHSATGPGRPCSPKDSRLVFRPVLSFNLVRLNPTNTGSLTPQLRNCLVKLYFFTLIASYYRALRTIAILTTVKQINVMLLTIFIY